MEIASKAIDINVRVACGLVTEASLATAILPSCCNTNMQLSQICRKKKQQNYTFLES